MTPEELFTAALGLGRQWRVAECRFEGEPKRLELRIEHVPGEHFECPHCKALSGVYWFRGSPEEIKEEASGYIAYSGPFHTDEAKKTLTHSMFVSLFPNWLGQTQPRVVKIEGDTLHLSTEKPIKSGGKETMSYLPWKRAEPI